MRVWEGRAMKGEMHTVVGRPVEEVFDFLADIRNEMRWNPRIVRIAQTSAGSIGAGTTFEGQYQGLGTLRTQLVEYERPRRISFRSTGARMHINGTIVLTPAGDGTDVSLHADLEPQGIFKVVAPLMGPVIRRQNRAAGVRLKQAVEAGGGSANATASGA
jgi:carbon monoxide dehydrogenase subunit G